MNEINKLRNQIDSINLQILDLLVQRLKVVEEIGRQKKLHEMSSYSPDRVRQMHNLLAAEIQKYPELESPIKRIFERVFEASHEHIQTRLSFIEEMD